MQRVTKEADIPDFLRESVRVPGDTIQITCVEGDEECPVGSVIGYEGSQTTSTGYNCWCIGNAATNLVEIDGALYKKATIMEAALLTEEYPEFLKGAEISRNDDGSWSIKTDWG
ncbi:MAG: hypothetical protein K5837_05690 [Candidatus Saccharibacteria bacterium]|nr:hypothetical protein [Candidatus Saccharibacteria bacterium]